MIANGMEMREVFPKVADGSIIDDIVTLGWKDFFVSSGSRCSSSIVNIVWGVGSGGFPKGKVQTDSEPVEDECVGNSGFGVQAQFLISQRLKNLRLKSRCVLPSFSQ